MEADAPAARSVLNSEDKMEETSEAFLKAKRDWGNFVLIALIIILAPMVLRLFDIARDIGKGELPANLGQIFTPWVAGFQEKFHIRPRGPEGIGDLIEIVFLWLGSLPGAAAAALTAYNAPYIGRRRKRVLGKEAILGGLLLSLAMNAGLFLLHWIPDLYRPYFPWDPRSIDWVFSLSLVQVVVFLVIVAWVSRAVNRAAPGDWIERAPVRHVAAGSSLSPFLRVSALSVSALVIILIVLRSLTLANLDTRRLVRFASQGDAAQVRLMLARRINVNAMDPQGRRALLGACLSGSEEAVGLLLDHGADVNAADRLNRTPLDMACLGLHPGIVRLLLDKGAVIDDECLPSACRGYRKIGLA